MRRTLVPQDGGAILEPPPRYRTSTTVCARSHAANVSVAQRDALQQLVRATSQCCCEAGPIHLLLRLPSRQRYMGKHPLQLTGSHSGTRDRQARQSRAWANKQQATSFRATIEQLPPRVSKKPATRNWDKVCSRRLRKRAGLLSWLYPCSHCSILGKRR